MNLPNLSGSNLIALASSLAVLISQDLTTDEIGLLAAFFTALGDNLALSIASPLPPKDNF